MLLCGGSYMVKIKLKVFIDCLSPPQLWSIVVSIITSKLRGGFDTWGYPKSWMVYFMENLIYKGMI